MTARTQLAYLSAVLLLASGLLGLVNPLLAVRLAGLEVMDPRGLTEARAVFGALFAAMGGALLWAVPSRPRGRLVLRAIGLAWLTVAVGRTLSLVIDGAVTPGSFVLLAFDLVVGLGALQASFEERFRRGRPAAEAEADDPMRAYRS